MTTYQLNKVQYLPIGIEEAWAFFSSPLNLAKITPPEMRFVVHTDVAGKPIYTGMKIDYTVRPLYGIPMHWVTGIKHVDEPRSFTDEQLKGPYALWEHTHYFEPVAGGVRMTDDLKYALPFGALGGLVHQLVVKKKLAELFAFRERTLENLFGKYS